MVVNRLENVSKEAFSKHYDLITELVSHSPGIYALYAGSELYYVGKSTELRKRVRQHLKDRHLASWSHFSLYLARREEHIGEIESLLVRIANPKGNRVIPRGRSTGPLAKLLKSRVRAKQKRELQEMFSDKRAAGRTTQVPSRSGNGLPLAGLVAKRTKLFRTYKGREYVASISPSGEITLGGKRYKSATAAARAVIKRKGAINGRAFWYIRDANGDWVTLGSYKV